MRGTEVQAWLLEKTRRSYDRSVKAEGVGAAIAGSPEPGDVVVLGATADFDVEWAVLARDAEALHRLLVVPADGNPLVGSGDVEAHDATPSGRLVLRCRFALRVDDGVIASGKRTGILGSGDVARAWQTCMKVAAGAVTGTALEREVDEDPEYQDWEADVLSSARNALAGEAEDAPGVRRSGRVGRRSGEERRVVGFWPLASIAASLLLVVVGGLLIWRQHQKIEALLADRGDMLGDHHAEVVRLETELDRRTEQLEEESERSREQYVRLERDYGGQIQRLTRDLEMARRGSGLTNPVVALLEPAGGLRGDIGEIVLPSDSSHVVFFLPLGDLPPAPRYRIELARKGTNDRVWLQSDLTRQPPGEIRSGLPTSLLRRGEYHLRLSGLDDGRYRLLTEYGLRIETE